MTSTVRADGQPTDRPEERWAGASKAELARLRAWVLDQGHSMAIANGLVGALVDADLEQLPSPNTRASYRRILREYGPPSGRGRPQRRTRARGAVRKLAAVAALVTAGSGVGAQLGVRDASAAADGPTRVVRTPVCREASIGSRRRRRAAGGVPKSLAA